VFGLEVFSELVLLVSVRNVMGGQEMVAIDLGALEHGLGRTVLYKDISSAETLRAPPYISCAQSWWEEELETLAGRYSSS
jgi:hypothetical protein